MIRQEPFVFNGLHLPAMWRARSIEVSAATNDAPLPSFVFVSSLLTMSYSVSSSSSAGGMPRVTAAAVTLGMPPAELLDDTLYDIVNNDDTNTNEGKGASLVAALTSMLLARHIAGRCNPLKTKGSCRITMMATGANRYPQRESNSRCQIESLVS